MPVKNLTTKQVELLGEQRTAIDNTFADVANILKQRGLERITKKKLTRVLGLLDKASDLVLSLIEEDEVETEAEAEEGEAEVD